MSLILSGTDGLSDVDGSAATPAIRGTDANTGIFFPAADTIAFSEGGVEAMRIDSSGNLLVNTTTAQTGAKLSVTGGISGTITSGTAVASTSGTSIDFTSLPSWIKRITVMFNEVSGSGTSFRLIQLGTGSTTYTTSGYLATTSVIATTVNTTSSTAGFIMYQDNAAYVFSGHMTFTNVSGNIWISSHIGKAATTITALGGGSVTLGSVLTGVRITTVNGTDTFDAGSINILYEG